MRTAAETAILLAVILNRSDQTRARVSSKTIKRLAGRSQLRSAFVLDVIEKIAEFEWILFEIGSGGFGAVQTQALEAAKPVLAKKWLNENELQDLRNNESDWTALKAEADPEQKEQAEEE